MHKKILEFFASPIFGPALSVAILACIKSDLKEVLESFPIYAYEGKPGVGKTSSVKACMLGEVEELSFSDLPRKVAEKIETTDKAIVFLDDLADVKSQGIREKGFKNIDSVVRKSYSGDGPLVIITAERKALLRQADSCRQRMICVDADDALIGENKRVLRWLQEHRKEMKEMYNQFEEWYKGQKYDYREMLYSFRERYASIGTCRQIDMLFSYFTSLQVFSDFMSEKKYGEMNQGMLEQSVEYLLDSMKKDVKEESYGITELLNLAIESKMFRVQFPPTEELCEKYLKGDCADSSFKCEDYCENLYRMVTGYINPQNLIINFDLGFNSVLVRDICEIAGCSRYIPNGPVLIVDTGILTDCINDCIMKKSIIEKKPFKTLTDIMIHKKLYENRQCFFKPNDKSLRYSVAYRCSADKQIKKHRVCILRLTENQYQMLMEQAEVYRVTYNFVTNKESIEIARAVRLLVSNLQFLQGEIGKSVYEEVKLCK